MKDTPPGGAARATAVRQAHDGRVPGASKGATAILAALAFIVLLSAAGATAAEQDGRVVVRRRRRPVSREMKELGRTQGEEFLGLALGAAAGLLAASILSALWRRSPLVARALAGVGLAAATALVLGPWLLTGRVNPTMVGAGIAWLLLVATLIWVFRPSVVAERRQSLSWLRVPPSRADVGAAKEPRPRQEATGGAGGPASGRAEADAARDQALAALDGGDVEGAVEGLRRSIEIRPTKRAHTLLGTVLGARGEKESALVEIGHALDLDPGYGEALDEKARILGELGRAVEAAAAGEKRKVSGPGPAARSGKPPETPDLPELGKRRPRVAAARGPGTLAPWIPAAAFSGAVVAGALLSLVYAAGWEYVAARRAIAVLDDARAGMSLSAEAAPPVRELERRRLDMIRGNGFTRDRAASLKLALAIHAYGRAQELAGGDAALSTWAAGWARRRIAEARAALSAGDRTKLPMGLADAFAAQREDFELELERRSTGSRRRAAETGRAAASSRAQEADDRAARDWRSIWKRPAPGATFLIEAFTRTGLTATGARAPVGSHGDGSPLAAVGLLRCTVAPSPSGHEAGEEAEEAGGAFVLLVEALPFGVKHLEEHPDGIPPAVRLAAKEPSGDASAAGGRFRIEFGPGLEFRSLVSLAGDGGEETVVVSRADLYAAHELPFKSLPIFSPGLSAGWEEGESFLWPYEGAVRGKGPAIKQVTHWKTEGGVTEMRVGWRMRYMLETKEYMEQVVQAWTPGRAWWDFYDDGVLFFRTAFGASTVEGETSGEGTER